MFPKKTRTTWIEDPCHTLKHTPEAAQVVCEAFRGYAERPKLSLTKRESVTAARSPILKTISIRWPMQTPSRTISPSGLA